MNQALKLAQHLSAPLHLGELTRFGSLTLFPVFGAPPRMEYRGLSAALHDGTVVTELRDASVNAVLFDNPGKLPVLLFEGESIQGAQQDRIIDGHRLVPSNSVVPIPVCCVERGRWQGSRHQEAFEPSDHVASPDIRARMKTTQRMSRSRRASQREVWASVATLTSTHGVATTTGAFGDVVETRRTWVDELVKAAPLQAEQLGWLVFAHGEFMSLDYVSRPEVWQGLAAGLLRGYAIEAEVEVRGETTRAQAEEKLDELSRIELTVPENSSVGGDPKRTHLNLSWLPAVRFGSEANSTHSAPSPRPPAEGVLSSRSYRCHVSGVEGSVLATPSEALAVSFVAA